MSKVILVAASLMLFAAESVLAADFVCPPPGNQSEANCVLFPKKAATFVVSVKAQAKANGHGSAWISLDMMNGDKSCNGKATKKFPFTGAGEVSDVCVVKVKADEVVEISARSGNENADATGIKISLEQR